MATRRPLAAAIYGIDLGKNYFDVFASDATGKPIQRLKLTRYTIIPFFESAAAALIDMEACPGAQWLARKFAAVGHTVRIIPAQFVANKIARLVWAVLTKPSNIYERVDPAHA